mgnify:CR=1 FL=1
MKLYIWQEWATFDEDLMNDKIFNYLATQCDDIAFAENNIEYEWEYNVDEIDATAHQVREYMINGYIFLEHGSDE